MAEPAPALYGAKHQRPEFLDLQLTYAQILQTHKLGDG